MLEPPCSVKPETGSHKGWHKGRNPQALEASRSNIAVAPPIATMMVSDSDSCPLATRAPGVPQMIRISLFGYQKYHRYLTVSDSQRRQNWSGRFH